MDARRGTAAGRCTAAIASCALSTSRSDCPTARIVSDDGRDDARCAAHARYARLHDAPRARDASRIPLSHESWPGHPCSRRLEWLQSVPEYHAWRPCRHASCHGDGTACVAFATDAPLVPTCPPTHSRAVHLQALRAAGCTARVSLRASVTHIGGAYGGANTHSPAPRLPWSRDRRRRCPRTTRPCFRARASSRVRLPK